MPYLFFIPFLQIFLTQAVHTEVEKLFLDYLERNQEDLTHVSDDGEGHGGLKTILDKSLSHLVAKNLNP